MKKIIALNAVIACILMCFFVSIVSRGGGDDYNFVVQASQCSIDKWIYTRFMTHSGRVVAEAFFVIFFVCLLFIFINMRSCLAMKKITFYYLLVRLVPFG